VADKAKEKAATEKAAACTPEALPRPADEDDALGCTALSQCGRSVGEPEQAPGSANARHCKGQFVTEFVVE